MRDPEPPLRPDAARREKEAEALVARLFEGAGWRVRRHPERADRSRPDMVLSRSGASYVVELKAAPEGRSDRLVPLWAQASLQAVRAAGERHPPLAIVAAPKIAPRVARQILKFAAEYAPDVAAGVVDFAGLCAFRGPHLDGLDSGGSDRPSAAVPMRDKPADLFSDLNQWMLKVLLAPELPESLLSAPRGRYRNASQLARAAHVSVMSAFRLVQHLQQEGFLHEGRPYLELVRKEELFRRWQAAAARRVHELPARFRLRGEPKVELKRMMRSGRACLGLYAAADVLGLGLVRGVPPHVYVERLAPANIAAWKNIVPAERGEVPDLILRQAFAPQSIFRGLVRADDLAASDVMQVWLDVSSHPSRGAEQGDEIRRRVLQPILDGRRG